MSEKIEEKSDAGKIKDIEAEIEKYESDWESYIGCDAIKNNTNEEDSRRMLLRLLKLMAERQKIIVLQNNILIQQNKELREFMQTDMNDRK